MEEISKQHKFKDNAIAHSPKVTSYTNTYSFADKKLNLYNSRLRSSVTGDSFSKNTKESNANKRETKHNSPRAVIPSFMPTSLVFSFIQFLHMQPGPDLWLDTFNKYIEVS